MLQIQLLGAFSLGSGKRPILLSSRSAQSLFAYLVLNAGTAHRREKLAGQLWPDSTEETARDYLRHALWRIRKALDSAASAHLLAADDLTIAFDASGDYQLDTAIILRAGESRSPDELMKALRAYGGELLPGFYDDWVLLERDHLQAIYEKQMGRLLDLLQEAGRWPDVLEWAENWIAFGQRPEPAYRALMRAHATGSDMSGVAAAFERCVKTLREFGMEPSDLTRSLYDDIKSGKHPSAPDSAAVAPLQRLAPTSNIPVPLTSFIGRKRELKKIAELLVSSRLVTLTGPGGVGKTRLAICAAREALKDFPDGACWVDLVGLADPHLVPQEIAQALHIREVAPEPLVQTIVGHLKARRFLLILDNCEHLIGACAQIAEQLLAACPDLRILATSVEGLDLFSEVIWQVPSLPMPADPGSIPAKELAQIESVRLFADRAANANASFALDERNMADAAQICRRLEGIPLAIELAAARIKVLSVREIATRLDDRFSLLTAGSRTAIPRHQTLRATIDWSHELLAELERVLFRRLAVFAGGFTLGAAEAVCSSGMPGGAILDLLGRLVGKSLVVVDAAELGETRYHLLETIRQYALEKLVAAGEVPETRQRHLDFYLQRAEESETFVFSRTSATWFRRLHLELDDLRSAIEWAMTAGEADKALRILGAMVYFWFAHGLPGSEWKDRVQLALDRPEGRGHTLARAKALNGIGFMYWADSYPLDRHHELDEALTIGKELADEPTQATALRNLGLTDLIQENYSAAREKLEHSLELWDEIGPSGKMGRAITLSILGDAALRRDDSRSALSIFRQAVAILEDLGDSNYMAYCVRRLGLLALRDGDITQAAACCKRSLELNLQVDDPRGLVACLAGFAAVALSEGKSRRAAVLAAATERQLEALRVHLLFLDRLEFEANVARLRSELQPKVLTRSWAEGTAMSMERAIAFALESGD